MNVRSQRITFSIIFDSSSNQIHGIRVIREGKKIESIN